MTWRTHVAIGTNAIWLAGFLGKVDESILVLLPTAVLASILPDIDAVSAKIHYVGGGVFGIFKNSFHGKYFHHRGLMHSILATVILFVILLILFKNSHPMLPFVFALAYFSHTVIDGFNTKVGYLYPFVYKRFSLLPQPLLFRVGSAADTILMFLGLSGILIFFALFKDYLIPTGATPFGY